MSAFVTAVSADAEHRFSKQPRDEILLVAGLGVDSDAHCGVTVKHRSRVRADPTKPNLRQVHLIHAELLDDVATRGFTVSPGALGENITTRGVPLLGLPRGTLLRLGETAVVRVTGLRNPCTQIDDFQPGLRAEMLDRTDRGEIIRRSGVMSVVLTGGVVRPDDPITVELPAEPHLPLEKV